MKIKKNKRKDWRIHRNPWYAEFHGPISEQYQILDVNYGLDFAYL